MGTIRHHVRIDAPADQVWSFVTDPAGIVDWVPGVDSCTFDGEVRTLETMGIEVQERIVTNDADLRRLQYSIVGGAMMPEHHIATIDILEDGDGSLAIYSCDLLPDNLVDIFNGIYFAGAQAIKAHAEA